MAEVSRLADLQNMEPGINVTFLARISQVKKRPGKFEGNDIFFDLNDGSICNSGRMFRVDPTLDFNEEPRMVTVTAQRSRVDRGTPSWNVNQIKTTDMKCRDFLRKATGHTELVRKLGSTLEGYKKGSHGNMGKIAEQLIRKHWIQFITWPASMSVHHSYFGGLLEHSFETQHNTIEHFYSNMDKYPNCSIRLLEVGSLIHDIGKIRTIYFDEDTGESLPTPFMKLSNHTIEGISMLQEFCHIDSTESLALKHIIAAHHGSIHYGAIIEPSLVEAYLINIGDGMSGKYNHQSNSIAVSGLTGWS